MTETGLTESGATESGMTGWRWGFALAALFNVAVGLPMLLAPAAIAAALATAADPLLLRLLGWLIISFGVGYALVAQNPRAQRGIALLGVIGKGGVVAIIGTLAAQGLVAPRIALLASGDLAFVVMFLLFLRRTRR